MYHLWVFVHIAGAIGFLAAHGASAAVALRLRHERAPERVRALLDLSASTRPFMYGSLAVLLVGGIVAGFLGHWWRQGWISAALVLLVVLLVAAGPLAVPYYRRVRQAVAVPAGGPAEPDPQAVPVGGPADPGAREQELADLLDSTRPVVIAVVEVAGVLGILWLMVAKPF